MKVVSVENYWVMLCRETTAAFFMLFFFFSCSQAPDANNTTDSPSVESPDRVFGSLFEAVQMKQVFPDGKTFVDCTPRYPVRDILVKYEVARDSKDFDLTAFIKEHFDLPEQPPTLELKEEKDIKKHIEALWPLLSRQPAPVVEGSSLLPLPRPYIVPGGRFREIYYWDSYFTMLGLRASGRLDMIADMVENFAHLIRTYGHIPNGNRSYYLSRSQPPFFSLMVKLLAEAKADETIYDQYLDAVEKEYMYWMEGDKEVKPGEALRKVVKMPDGSLLNRYCDESLTPRPESYRQDVETAKAATLRRMEVARFPDSAAAGLFERKIMAQVYNDLRSGAESGWDFSSRWFGDEGDLESIQTTQIIPVDLNSLLYQTESLLAAQYERRGDKKKADDYKKWAEERGDAIIKYCWDAGLGFFTDYHFVKQQSTGKITAAGYFPLCLLSSSHLGHINSSSVGFSTARYLLAPGGLLTTPVTVKPGQQWDNPNGWAPLQWMAVWGLERIGEQELARTTATRWIKLNKDVYDRTGKLMEKYNVVNTKLDAGGGEYPGQDGFGWTNGVLLALMEKYGE